MSDPVLPAYDQLMPCQSYRLSMNWGFVIVAVATSGIVLLASSRAHAEDTEKVEAAVRMRIHFTIANLENVVPDDPAPNRALELKWLGKVTVNEAKAGRAEVRLRMDRVEVRTFTSGDPTDYWQASAETPGKARVSAFRKLLIDSRPRVEFADLATFEGRALAQMLALVSGEKILINARRAGFWKNDRKNDLRRFGVAMSQARGEEAPQGMGIPEPLGADMDRLFSRWAAPWPENAEFRSYTTSLWEYDPLDVRRERRLLFFPDHQRLRALLWNQVKRLAWTVAGPARMAGNTVRVPGRRVRALLRERWGEPRTPVWSVPAVMGWLPAPQAAFVNSHPRPNRFVDLGGARSRLLEDIAPLKIQHSRLRDAVLLLENNRRHWRPPSLVGAEEVIQAQRVIEARVRTRLIGQVEDMLNPPQFHVDPAALEDTPDRFWLLARRGISHRTQPLSQWASADPGRTGFRVKTMIPSTRARRAYALSNRHFGGTNDLRARIHLEGVVEIGVVSIDP